MFEMTLWYFEYAYFSATGVKPMGIIFWAVTFGAVKKTVACLPLLVVSMGYGVVRPTLGGLISKVLLLGATYFLASELFDAERERQFEIEIRRSKGLEVRRMIEDGNCLFRVVVDQVYGDLEVYDVTRQMRIGYMEKERDHFSQFVAESFTACSKRKRRDKVYGNNLEIQAMSEIYNRPIHIYSYSTEPINIFHGSYGTDSPPIQLSYHRGNHYNSLVDPHRLTIGAGLGFSSLQGKNIDKDQVKAAIKAQQDQRIENALLAKGRNGEMT